VEFNDQFNANLLLSTPVKEFSKSIDL